jgi:hypothetical protein
MRDDRCRCRPGYSRVPSFELANSVEPGTRNRGSKDFGARYCEPQHVRARLVLREFQRLLDSGTCCGSQSRGPLWLRLRRAVRCSDCSFGAEAGRSGWGGRIGFICQRIKPSQAQSNSVKPRQARSRWITPDQSGSRLIKLDQAGGTGGRGGGRLRRRNGRCSIALRYRKVFIQFARN